MRNAKDLTYEEISKYFSCPIHQACIYLKVERNDLKKRCEELKIKKWPYRQYQRKKIEPPQGMFSTITFDTDSPRIGKEKAAETPPDFIPDVRLSFSSLEEIHKNIQYQNEQEEEQTDPNSKKMSISNLLASTQEND
jgi:hypothetical protein